MTRASIKPVKRLLVGGVGAALLALGCSGDPALFLGGPASSTAAIQLSTNRFILRAAESATIGAQARDEVGNPTADAVSFTACDAKVTVASGESTTQWAQVATVTGVALGESCVVASTAGLADTIRVAIGPGSVMIVGPDTVLSGTAASYGLEFYDLNGTQLTAGPDFQVPELVSLNTLRLPVSAADPLTYDAAGQQPGKVTIQTITSADFASVSDTKTVTIVPGVFGGTFSTSTAAQGASVTVTGAIPWDADTYVTINGVAAANWTGLQPDAVVNPSSGSLTFQVPWSVPAGTYSVIVNNQGPGQVAQIQTGFTVTAGVVPANNQQTPRSANNTSGTELRTRLSLDRPLAWPVIWNPGVTGTNYSYYTLNNTAAAGEGNRGEVVIRATLDWIDSCGAVCGSSTDEDFDIEIINGGFTAFIDLDAATLAKPEITHFNANDGSFYFFRYRTYSGGGAAHAVIQWLGDGGLCSDEDGCRIGGVP